jgi:hypothetical protein
LDINEQKMPRLSTNVRNRLSQLREGFESPEQFIDYTVRFSFDDPEQIDERVRHERLKFLNDLQKHSQKHLAGKDLIRFDRLSKNPSQCCSLFELIQKIAGRRLEKKGEVVQFPDWLLTSLERQTAHLQQPDDQSESSAARYDEEPERMRTSPQRSTPQYDEFTRPAEPPKWSTPQHTEFERMPDPYEDYRTKPVSYPKKSSPNGRPGQVSIDALESLFANARMEEGATAAGRDSPRARSKPSKSPTKSSVGGRARPKSKSPTRSSVGGRDHPKSKSPTRSSVGGRDRPKSKSPTRQSVGGRSPRSKASAEGSLAYENLESPRQKSTSRTQAGARAPLDLTQTQRVALHFMTPGDASRQTLIDFVDLVKPLSAAGVNPNIVYDPNGPVSEIRNYAYELWLNQTDEQLFALADEISGGTGVIHPTIEQELTDAVGRYAQQLKDIKDNGTRVLDNIKTQAQKLKGKARADFESCYKNVKEVLEPESAKVPCVNINAEDYGQGVKLPANSKWLKRSTTNLDSSEAKFLMDMSSSQIEEFADYVVSQSAIGTCRLSRYLEEFAKGLEAEYQSIKKSGDVPPDYIDKLETLRFLEWTLRRPAAPRTKNTTATWLLKYPYVQGAAQGEFRRTGEVKGKPILLSSKYASFKPRNANDQALGALFKLTNPENLDIMGMATKGDRFQDIF